MAYVDLGLACFPRHCLELEVSSIASPHRALTVNMERVE